MKIVTVATHNERYYPYLKASAKRNGYDLVTLGWNEKWRGFTWKFQVMRDYLKTLPDDEIVCFVDGYDVILLQEERILENTFRKIVGNDKNKIVVSSEVQPDNSVDKFIQVSWCSFFSYKCKNAFLNSGTYITYSSTLFDIYSNLCNIYTCKDDSDDQILLQQYCNRYPDNFILDTDCDIFLVMPSLMGPLKPNTNNISINDGILSYKNKTPCVLHAPAYTDIDDILDELKYDSTLFRARNEDKSEYRYKFIKHFLKELFNRYKYIIFTILIVLFTYLVFGDKIVKIFKKVFRPSKNRR